ncbi:MULTISPECIES: DNA polymerase IV [unclassified Bosea (in: a-proteobacteria)]|uniref:DNA polymerase IV n=1 Tax=unclassified Bosea (in: a-proteobacteria) TaxID=2653178 RepID=UPI000954ABC7|nr:MULTISPECIES: DNA polymerase IV [unclassified Bosea (in: a-proteobacteria)]TAJ27026.1 MAG: DNA polymerase IV [Bosea sp. (in: a-proteobacteria)]SIP89982.1 DNA polymerase-4 [Bosea sp. TND4EK4]
MRSLCRDCLSDHDGPGPLRRCPACGSPRLIRHPERDSLSLAHIDCDAFYATIEKRDDPSLQDKPLIIGGGKRGVVSTCCYIARTYGVRSAMPMFKALKACPEAVVVKPNMAKYVSVGRQVRQMMRDLTPLVEPLSIDEAFLDLSGTERLHHANPAETLARFARRVESELGITVSVGLSYAKFLAKVASDLDKPRGFSIIGRGEAVAFLADKPVGMIPGMGPAGVARLAEAGFRLIGDLREAPVEKLFRLAGKDGPRLKNLANGIDPRKVTPDRETKSISSETTLDVDLSAFDELEPILWRLCEKTSRRLKEQELAGRTITLKLKTSEFHSITRASRLPEPTQLAARLFTAGRDLLKRECTGARYRLIGIGASDFSPPSEADHGDLADLATPRLKAMEGALDALRTRFGDGAIGRGLSLRLPQRSPGEAPTSRRGPEAEDPDA